MNKLTIIAIFSIIIAGLIWGAASLGAPQEKQNMETTNKASTDTNATIPPIDASAPARTETATFALG